MTKNFLAVAALTLASLASASAFAQNAKTAFTANSMKVGGTTITTGTVSVKAMDRTSTSLLSLTTADGDFNGPDGSGVLYSTTIANGAIANGFVVADQSTATPSAANTPLYYVVTVTSTAPVKGSYTVQLPPGTVTGSTFALDHYTPAQTAALVSGTIVTTTLPASMKCGGAGSRMIVYSGTTITSVYECVNGTFRAAPVGSNSGASLPSGTGLVKTNNGAGALAVAGTDYQAPLTAGTDYATPASVTAATNAAAAAQATANAAQPGFTYNGTPAFKYDFRASGSLADASGHLSALSPCTSGAPTFNALDHGLTFSTTQNAAVGPCLNVPLANGVSLRAIEFDVYAAPTAYTQSTAPQDSMQNALLGPTNNYNSADQYPNYELFILAGTGYGPEIFLGGGASMHTTAADRQLQAGHHVVTLNCTADGGHIYIDGAETPYKLNGGNCQNNLTNSPAGQYVLGGGNLSQASWYGKMYQFVGYTTSLTAAQVIDNQKKYLAADALLGIPAAPVPQNFSSPVAVGAGTSIEAGTNGAASCAANAADGLANTGCGGSWLTQMTWPAAQARTVVNYGIFNTSIGTIVANTTWREATVCAAAAAAGANIPAFVGSPSNNENNATTATAAWSLVTDEVALLKKAGCSPIFVVTALSRGGGYDAGKNAYTTLARNGYKAAGADGIIDHTAIASMGADGAYSAGRFPDQTHPDATGYTLMATAGTQALAAFYGAKSSAPTVVTANYTMGAGDTSVSLQPTAAIAVTLPSCVGQTDAEYRFTNLQSTFAVTLKTNAAAETLNGNDYSSTGFTVPSNSIIKLRDVPNAPSVSGCHWEM